MPSTSLPTTSWQTPFCSWTPGPPSSGIVTSSPGAREDPVAADGLHPVAPRGDGGADGLEGARIAEQLEALARPLSHACPLGGRERSAHGTARQRTALWPPKPNEFEIAIIGA